MFCVKKICQNYPQLHPHPLDQPPDPTASTVFDIYCIYLAIRQGFPLSRMTTNN